MKKKSEKQKKIDAELSKIKKELPKICFARGCCNTPTDLMHILPRSLYPEYITKRENLILGCREHHNLFDDNIDFRKRQKHVFLQVADFDLIGATKYFKL